MLKMQEAISNISINFVQNSLSDFGSWKPKAMGKSIFDSLEVFLDGNHRNGKNMQIAMWLFALF